MASQLDLSNDIYLINGLTEQVKFVDRLSTEMKQSILWYTMEGNAQSLNKFLKKSKGNPKFSSSDKHLELQHHYQNLKFIFQNVPALNSVLTVYRGIDIEFNEKYSPHTFVSTSLDENVSRGFTSHAGSGKCCMLRITVNRGAKLIPVLYQYSHHPREKEILLDNDFNMSLNQISEEHDKTYYDLAYSNGILLDSRMSLATVTKVVNSVNEEEQLFNEVIKFKIKEQLIDRIRDKKELEDKILIVIKNINKKFKYSDIVVNNVYKNILVKYEKEIN